VVVMITLMIKFNDRIQLWSERPVKMHKDEIAIFAKSLALTPQREVTRDQAMTAAHFDREGRKVDSDRNAYVAEKSGN